MRTNNTTQLPNPRMQGTSAVVSIRCDASRIWLDPVVKSCVTIRGRTTNWDVRQGRSIDFFFFTGQHVTRVEWPDGNATRRWTIPRSAPQGANQPTALSRQPNRTIQTNQTKPVNAGGTNRCLRNFRNADLIYDVTLPTIYETKIIKRSGKASDALGRKTAIAIACGIFITGAGGMTLSLTYTQLLVGRLLTGLGVGCGFVVAPVYITEITPAHIRGKLVALTDIMINIGILLGACGLCGRGKGGVRVTLNVGDSVFMRSLVRLMPFLFLQGRVVLEGYASVRRCCIFTVSPCSTPFESFMSVGTAVRERWHVGVTQCLLGLPKCPEVF